MKRLFGLQYLRALAACSVVTYHAADRAGFSFAAGQAGVDLFFVLSGFLMWAITDATSRPGRFLADRAKRIVPSYWIVTSVMLAGAIAGLFPAVRLTVTHIVTSYAFVPAVSPSNGQVWPLLVPGWTLNYETGFYLLFALALLLPRAVQLVTLTVVLIALAVVHPFADSDAVLLHFYTDPHILEFLGGLWLARCWRMPMFARAGAGPMLLVATLALSALALILPSNWSKAVLYGPPAIFGVAAVLAYERRAAGIPEVPMLRLLGDASYSIYLWHTLAISVAAKLVARLDLPGALAILVMLVAGMGIGLLAYGGIERPLMQYFHRRRSRHGVTPGP